MNIICTLTHPDSEVLGLKRYLLNNTLINTATPYVKIAVVHVCTVHLVHTS